MANKKKNKSNNKQKKIVAVVQRPGLRQLDDKGKEYARLLMDPCSAPLVHPVYPGGDAGFLFRGESFVTFGNGVSDTAAVVHWTPGYVNATNTELVYLNGTSGAFSGTTVTSALSPGRAFLAANARGVRCVAACLKITFPGAESARSGRVHYGHTTAGTIDAGQTVTADQVAVLLQHYGRTPTDTIEVFWRPGIADTEFNDPTETASAPLRDRKSSITVAFAGLPAAVGLTFHFTAIYEWTPVQNLGVANNALGKNQSRNSMDDVLDVITRAGFRFVKHVGMAGMNYMAGNVANQVQSIFGLMPATGRNRARQYLTQ